MTNLNDTIWTPEDPDITTNSDHDMQLLCIAPNGSCGNTPPGGGGGITPGMIAWFDCPNL